MHPRAPGLRVLDVRRPDFLLLGEPGVFTWLLQLEPLSSESTRLIVRSRGSFGLPRLLGYGLEPAHFVMERKMLHGIRDRAEAAAGGFGAEID